MKYLQLFSVWLIPCAAGCVSFDEYPEGDLCANAVRDAEGRAIHYPEWRICRPLVESTLAASPTSEEADDGSSASAVVAQSATFSGAPDAAQSDAAQSNTALSGTALSGTLDGGQDD